MKKLNDIINDLLLLLGTTITMIGAFMLYFINYQALQLIIITIAVLILIKIYIFNATERKVKERKRYEKSLYRKEVQS